MILLDWTRMGKIYCLAGAVAEKDGYRVVRPLLARYREAAVRNVGWSGYLLDGHQRWEIFELLGPEPAAADPPHLEDLWVRALRSRRCLAPVKQRRDILAATATKSPEPIFGTPLVPTRSAAYVPPGSGQRSLATLVVPSCQICFTACQRDGALERDYRVSLPLPELGTRALPLKDHHLLRRAQAATGNLQGQVQVLNDALHQMGEQVAVRLGLSRPFQTAADRGPSMCWLMADGFFSLTDPQP